MSVSSGTCFTLQTTFVIYRNCMFNVCLQRCFHAAGCPANTLDANLVSIAPVYVIEPDDVIQWKHFPLYWPSVRGIHRSPMDSPHKGQWRGALMFSLICAWINGWVNNREAGDLRRHPDHYDVTVMTWWRKFTSSHKAALKWGWRHKAIVYVMYLGISPGIEGHFVVFVVFNVAKPHYHCSWAMVMGFIVVKKHPVWQAQTQLKPQNFILVLDPGRCRTLLKVSICCT